MEVRAWSSGGGTYGIRVGIPNRNKYFDPAWTRIEVLIDGHSYEFALTPGFWNKCPEFRDSGCTVIREWLQQHHTLEWPKRSPPRFQLLPLSSASFRLVE
jgi:hypothetical protein